MGIEVAMPNDCSNINFAGASSSSNASSGADFLSLLAGLMLSGESGKEALISLLNTNGSENENNIMQTLQSNNLLDNSMLNGTISTLIKEFSAKIDGQNVGLNTKNFILDEAEVDRILENLKSLSKNDMEASLSQYLNGINEANGFLKLKAMQNLNTQAQNTNISSTIQGMMLNIPSENKENKQILNALKFLQQFTNQDGSLDTSKLLKALETNSKGDNTSFMNSMMQHGSNTEGVNTSLVKTAHILKHSDIVNVVVENFKTLRLPGRTELTIKLNPQELGEINIKLVLEKGQISAVLSADKKETFTMLQNNMQNLVNQLKESGTDLHHVSVNLTQDNNNGEEARRGYKEQEQHQQSFEEEFDDIFNQASNEDNIEEII